MTSNTLFFIIAIFFTLSQVIVWFGFHNFGFIKNSDNSLALYRDSRRHRPCGYQINNAPETFINFLYTLKTN